ncbi:RluA family pseudouridine synthase [Breznakiellaceae bacterium SP9]
MKKAPRKKPVVYLPHKRKQHTERLSHKIQLLYEDDDILVIDKPAGLLSIASETERCRTVYSIIGSYLRQNGERRAPAMVHRLDKETSGVMLLAKSAVMKKLLMDKWNDIVIERRYTAVCEGTFPAASKNIGANQFIVDDLDPTAHKACITAPLVQLPGGRVIVRQDGQRAVTHCTLLKQGQAFALLALELDTGRKNQIRVHLSYFGIPVAGDSKYGACSDPLKRLALHANSLQFYHPRTGVKMGWTAPIPPAFKTLLYEEGR